MNAASYVLLIHADACTTILVDLKSERVKFEQSEQNLKSVASPGLKLREKYARKKYHFFYKI